MARWNADAAKTGINSETVDTLLSMCHLWGRPHLMEMCHPPESSVKCCNRGGTCNADYWSYSKRNETEAAAPQRARQEGYFIRHRFEYKWEYNGAVHPLYRLQAYVSVRMTMLCNILIKFGIPTDPFRLIKTCLNETYICPRHFLYRMIWKKKMLYHHFFNFV